jgi:hypothetical protein
MDVLLLLTRVLVVVLAAFVGAALALVGAGLWAASVGGVLVGAAVGELEYWIAARRRR